VNERERKYEWHSILSYALALVGGGVGVQCATATVQVQVHPHPHPHRQSVTGRERCLGLTFALGLALTVLH
jgi:hypothetical protein